MALIYTLYKFLCIITKQARIHSKERPSILNHTYAHVLSTHSCMYIQHRSIYIQRLLVHHKRRSSISHNSSVPLLKPAPHQLIFPSISRFDCHNITANCQYCQLMFNSGCIFSDPLVKHYVSTRKAKYISGAVCSHCHR